MLLIRLNFPTFAVIKTLTMKHTLLAAAVVGFASIATAAAQTSANSAQSFAESYSARQPFRNLGISVTGGSMGIGVEAATKISNLFRVRAGVSTMPHWKRDMNFEVRVGNETARQYDSNGNRVESKFDRLRTRMRDLTGYDVDDQIVMEGRPKYWNAKLILDITPFTNKHWYLSAGFYLGNKLFADAEVSKDDMTTMLAVGLYNNMYLKAMNDEPFVTYNNQDVYNDQLADRLRNYGRMQYLIGYMKGSGEPCYADPDENGIIKVKAHVNRFKPYVGFGYQGRLSKAEPQWEVGFDAGMLFWGGKPHVYTDRTVMVAEEDPETGATKYSYSKERVDMARDLKDYPSNIKNKMSLLKSLVVMPVLDVKITRTF